MSSTPDPTGLIRTALNDALLNFDSYGYTTYSRNKLIAALDAYIDARVHAVLDDRLAQSIKAPPEQNLYEELVKADDAERRLHATAAIVRHGLTEHEQLCGIIAEDIKDWTKQPGDRARYTYAGYYMQRRERA